MKNLSFTVLILVSLFSCENQGEAVFEDENSRSFVQKNDTLKVEFINGVLAQNYAPDKYDLYRNIKGEFCFKTNYPVGTKAILSTYHYIESASDELEFMPFYDTIELTPTFCYTITGPHAFGTIGFKIPIQLQTEKIKNFLNKMSWIEVVFFEVVNQDIAKDTVNIEVEKVIP